MAGVGRGENPRVVQDVLELLERLDLTQKLVAEYASFPETGREHTTTRQHGP